MSFGVRILLSVILLVLSAVLAVSGIKTLIKVHQMRKDEKGDSEE